MTHNECKLEKLTKSGRVPQQVLLSVDNGTTQEHQKCIIPHNDIYYLSKLFDPVDLHNCQKDR
jgi:hypothetical protein